MRHSGTILLLCSVMVTTVSCSSDSPTEPTGFSGSYTLATVDSEALPIVDMTTLNSDTLFVTSGSVNVLSRGRVRIVKNGIWHLRGKPPEATTDTLVRPYRLASDTVFIDYQSGGLTGPYTDTALVAPNTLRIKMLVNRYRNGHFWRDMLYVEQ